MTETDILIVGGGPAGLSAAVNLARSLHTVIIFDSGQYRNALLPHLHGVPGWDHEDPATIRTRMHKDLLARYNTVSIVQTTVTRVNHLSDARSRFSVVDSEGREWFGKKLILATGVSDILPDIPGYKESWVKGIYHCLTSQGFEERDTDTAGVLGIGDCATVFACNRLSRQARQLARQVRIYTDGNRELTSQLTDSIDTARDNIVIEDRKIARLSHNPSDTSVTVFLEDGTAITERFLVHKPRMQVNGGFAEQLGLEMFTFGHEIIKVAAPFHETSLKGCFAIGDCASPQKVFLNALNMGSFACAGLAAQLQMEVD
ncbi:thioredoxin reductase glit [Xylariaceae sp. FL1651]|nr:thioredoxin reductase glit [Xylariaceae sp. FL1651]